MMTALIVSNVLAWITVVALGLVVLRAVARPVTRTARGAGAEGRRGGRGRAAATSPQLPATLVVEP